MNKQDPLAIFPYGDRGAHICISANFYRHKPESSTQPHSFAVALQVFADHNLLQSPENSLGVRELQPHV